MLQAPADLLGKRVVSVGEWGGNAEYAIATANRLALIPEGFDWRLGTCFQTSAYSAWHLIHTVGKIRAGDRVLLHAAAGSVAILAAQIAREAGATVYGLCGLSKMDFAGPYGYTELLDSRSDDWVDKLKDLTGGRGADLIVDGVAGPNAARNYDAAAPLGQVVYIGAMGGYPPPVDISRQLYAKTIAVRGYVVYVAMAATGGRRETGDPRGSPNRPLAPAHRGSGRSRRSPGTPRPIRTAGVSGQVVDTSRRRSLTRPDSCPRFACGSTTSTIRSNKSPGVKPTRNHRIFPEGGQLSAFAGALRA